MRRDALVDTLRTRTPGPSRTAAAAACAVLDQLLKLVGKPEIEGEPPGSLQGAIREADQRFVAEVERSEKVTVQARDRQGREFRVKGDELFARALQHEIDHLNGILYIDYLESLEELVRVSEASDDVREEATAGI